LYSSNTNLFQCLMVELASVRLWHTSSVPIVRLNVYLLMDGLIKCSLPRILAQSHIFQISQLVHHQREAFVPPRHHHVEYLHELLVAE